MLTEIIYGSSITNASDQINLSSVVDYWIGPNAVKREFEGTKRERYHFRHFQVWCWAIQFMNNTKNVKFNLPNT